MSVSVLIITHGQIGESLLSTLTHTLETLPLLVKAIPIHRDDDPDTVKEALKLDIADLNKGDGVLILTDMYGSTPGNIANALFHPNDTQIVSGLNLPMLMRIMNYPHLSLSALAEKAISGGVDGIVITPSRESTRSC